MSENEYAPTPYRAIIWKEWRDWRGGFALYTAGITGLVFYDLIYQRNRNELLPNFVLWQVLWGTFLPVLIAVAAACDDAARNTLSFTRSLPCSLRTFAWFRLGGAATVLIGPPLLGGLILLGWLAVFDQPSLSKMITTSPSLLRDFWQTLILLWIEQLGVLLLVAIVGAKRRSEVYVGACGAVIVVFHFVLRIITVHGSPEVRRWCHIMFPADLKHPVFQRGRLHPGLISVQLEQVWLPVLLHCLILAALAVWFTRRYGGVARSKANPESTWFGIRSLPQSLAHRASPLASLVWINLRQAVPLIAVAWLMLIPTMFMLFPFSRELTITLERSLSHIGAFWPAMIGSGLFATELRSNLGQFWRSRPISPRGWFWVKYIVGLIMVLITLDLAPIVFGGSIFAIYGAIEGTGPSVSWSIFGVYLACYPAMHAASYTIAVLGVCWIRKPALVVALTLTGLIAIDLSLKTNDRLSRFSPSYHTNSLEVLAYSKQDPWRYVDREFAITWGMLGLVTGVGAWAASRAACRNDETPLMSLLTSLGNRVRGRRAASESLS